MSKKAMIQDSEIKRYKSVQWFNSKTRMINFGVQVILKDGGRHDVCEGKKPLIFPSKKDAIATVRKFNKELKISKP